MNVRHTIFLSSTFRDLQEERQISLNAILALGYFPIGMEIFPAANSTPWDLIKTLIADADYYVLIIAGRYGAETTEGISYTEKEYDLAVELKKPILSFLHENTATLQADKVEMHEKSNEKLKKFRDKVLCNHLCKLWKEKHELGLYVTQSLLQAVKETPAKGWVRNDYNVTTLLNDLNNYRIEVDKLKVENTRLNQLIKSDTENNFKEKEKTKISFTIGIKKEDYQIMNMQKEEYHIDLSWGEIFEKIAPSLLYAIDFSRLNFLLSEVLKELLQTTHEIASIENIDLIRISDDCLQYILKYFLVHDLIDHKAYEIPNVKMNNVNIITKWFLTKKGEKKYLKEMFNL